MKKGCLIPLGALLCWMAAVWPCQAESGPIEPYYTFQTMILTQELNVRKTLNDLRQKGFPAYVVMRENQSSQMLYKVRIGKYATRAEAREAALDFKQREQQSYVLLKSQIRIPADEIEAAQQAIKTFTDKTDLPQKLDYASDNQSDTIPYAENADNNSAVSGEMTLRPAPPIQPTSESNQPDGPEEYYTFQFGSMRAGKLAGEKVEQMRQRGYPAYVIARRNEDGTLFYKMRIGKYPSRAEAQKAAFDFTAGEGQPAFVLKSQIDLRGILPTGALPNQQEPETLPADTQNLTREGDSRHGVAPVSTVRQDPEPAEADLDDLPETEPAQRADVNNTTRAAWPESVTKIFSYRSPSGALNLTNRYANIPKESHKDINQISVFPVRYRGPEPKGRALVFDVDGEEKLVRLSGVTLSPSLQSDYVQGYLALNLENVALRLKYSPWGTDAGGALWGMLYLKEGTCINTDMLRHGIGTCDINSCPPGMRKECQEMEALAKKKRVGMWAPR